MKFHHGYSTQASELAALEAQQTKQSRSVQNRAKQRVKKSARGCLGKKLVSAPDAAPAVNLRASALSIRRQRYSAHVADADGVQAGAFGEGDVLILVVNDARGIAEAAHHVVEKALARILR